MSQLKAVRDGLMQAGNEASKRAEDARMRAGSITMEAESYQREADALRAAADTIAQHIGPEPQYASGGYSPAVDVDRSGALQGTLGGIGGVDARNYAAPAAPAFTGRRG